MPSRPLFYLLIAALLAFSAPASAQEPVPYEAPPGAQSAETWSLDEPSDTERMDDEQALYEETTPLEERQSSVHPHEREDVAYNFLGAFYRHQFLPPAILKIFTAEAPAFNFPQAGLEFSRRKNGRDIIASVYYADFNGQGAFLAKNDPPSEVEWIDSNLYAVMGSVTFLWGSTFSDWFAIQAGIGLGVGALLGDLERTEAYPTADGHAPCVPPGALGDQGSAQPGSPYAGSPGTNIGQYCGAPNVYPSDPDGSDGEHYGVRARRWAQGGMVPNLWFRAAPQVSLRFKPMAQLVFRVDGGFDVFSGFFVGGALSFGLGNSGS